jgi:single-stranded-DNA-specific exonuclease
VCFKALKNSSSIKGLVDEEIISFIYAPKLNAPGRMGNSSCVVDLILTDDEKEADSIIKKLELDNKERIKYQSKAWNDVCKIVENLDLSKFNALTFASSDWHQGIIGIIASKAVDAWRKPTAVFSISSDGTAKGSIRSIDGVNVFNILSNLKNILEDFGGHEMAAGLSIKTEKIDEFKILFENEVKSVDALPPVLDIDVEVDIADMCINIVEQISSMSPFGSNNPKPTFVSKNIKILNKWIVKEKHLKLKFQNGDEAIGFNMSQMESGILNNINMVFSPTINDWNGKLQYRIIDIE